MKTLLLAAVTAALFAVGVASAREGHPGGVLRDRLVSELRMSPGQVRQLDAVFARVHPRLERLRELDGAERKRARHRVLADLNDRIQQILTPQQRPVYEDIVRDAASDGTAALVRNMR